MTEIFIGVVPGADTSEQLRCIAPDVEVAFCHPARRLAHRAGGGAVGGQPLYRGRQLLGRTRLDRKTGYAVDERIGLRVSHRDDARDAEECGFEDRTAGRIEMRGKAQYVHAAVGARDVGREANQVHAIAQRVAIERGLHFGAHALVQSEQSQQAGLQPARRRCIVAHHDELDVQTAVARQPRRLDQFLDALDAQQVADEADLERFRPHSGQAALEPVVRGRALLRGEGVVDHLDRQIGGQAGTHVVVDRDHRCTCRRSID